MCRCDGIGRRSGLKIHRWRQRTGSSPVTGTKRKSHPKGWLFLLVLCGHSAEPAVRPTTPQKCEPQAADFWLAECVQRAKRVAVRSPAPKKLNPCRGWAFFMSTEREPEVRVRGAGRAPPGADAARSASGSGQNFASKCAQEILGTATRTTGTKRKSHPKGWLFLLVLCGHSAEPAVRSAALQKCDTFWGYRIFYCSLGAYFVVFCRGACYYVKLGYCAFQTERNVWIWALSKL